MKTRIIVDSTADLMPGYKEQVRVVPLTVHFGDREYIDGVTIDHKTFYEKLVEEDTLPTTSQATPDAFAKEFEAAKQAGESCVVITLSGKLSGTCQSASIAAADYENVYVVDSGNASVGGGILTGGRLLEGARGLGGELGHYRTHALDGIPCTCGATGCWERYAATTALVRAAQEKDPAWKDGRAIFAAAEAGNETVLALLDAWTDEIAQGLAGMVHIFNPQLILIGGGVSAQQKLLIEPIAAKVRASVMPAFAEGLEIRAAQLHNDAGMVGAVYYFRQQHGEA